MPEPPGVRLGDPELCNSKHSPRSRCHEIGFLGVEHWSYMQKWHLNDRECVC